MKLSNFVLIFSLHLSVSEVLYSQSIQAGMHDSTCYWQDYVPDLHYQSKTSDPTHLYPEGSQLVDIDRDGTNDFIVETTSGGTSQTGWCFGRVRCLSAGASVLSHYESSLISMNTYDSLLVPNLLTVNALIQANTGTYQNGSSYLWSNPYGNYTEPWVASWNNASDNYIGLRLISNNSDTLYAWMHVAIDYTNAVYSLTIFDFACTKNPLVDYSVPLNNGIAEGNIETQILTYPVPSSNLLTISCNGNLLVESVSVYDMQGQVMMNQKGGSTRWSIPVSSWTNGCYLVRLHTAAGDVEKVIIKE